MRFVLPATVLATGLLSTPLMAGDAPRVLEPSSQWQINYADDSCRLARIFGEGENKIALYFERYEPGDSFTMTVAGAPLEKLEGMSSRIAFLPGGRTHDKAGGGLVFGSLGSFKPAFIIGNMTLFPLKSDDADSSRQRFDPERAASNTDIYGQEISPEQEATVEWLEISRNSRAPVRLKLTSLGPAFAAMRNCTDELLNHWGLDVDAHKHLSRAAAPASYPGDWIRDDDYPRNLVFNGTQGIVHFRLEISAEGKATACHIQQSTRPKEFDDLVCEKIMERARFTPALDALGNPIKSFYLNTVRFRMAS